MFTGLYAIIALIVIMIAGYVVLKIRWNRQEAAEHARRAKANEDRAKNDNSNQVTDVGVELLERIDTF